MCVMYINLHDSTLQNVGQKHCFDLQCSGFVQTNRDIVLGGKLSPVSKYGGPQAQLNIFFYQVCFCWYFKHSTIIFLCDECFGCLSRMRKKANKLLSLTTFTIFIFYWILYFIFCLIDISELLLSLRLAC
jgi:hypothetical protein